MIYLTHRKYSYYLLLIQHQDKRAIDCPEYQFCCSITCSKLVLVLNCMIRQIHNQVCVIVGNDTIYRHKCMSIQENNFLKAVLCNKGNLWTMRNQLHSLYLLWSQAFTPHIHGHKLTFSNIFVLDSKHLNQTPSTRIQTMSRRCSHKPFNFLDVQLQSL